jgi:hypothetical protein
LILTCDFVSTLWTHVPVLQFQKRIWRSAVPPPLANKLGCHGHHATAYNINKFLPTSYLTLLNIHTVSTVYIIIT